MPPSSCFFVLSKENPGGIPDFVHSFIIHHLTIEQQAPWDPSQKHNPLLANSAAAIPDQVTLSNPKMVSWILLLPPIFFLFYVQGQVNFLIKNFKIKSYILKVYNMFYTHSEIMTTVKLIHLPIFSHSYHWVCVCGESTGNPLLANFQYTPPIFFHHTATEVIQKQQSYCVTSHLKICFQ